MSADADEAEVDFNVFVAVLKQPLLVLLLFAISESILLAHAATIEDLKKVLSKEFDHLGYHATDGGIRYSSKVVAETDMLEYVDTGWEIFKELSNGKIVVRTVLNPRI